MSKMKTSKDDCTSQETKERFETDKMVQNRVYIHRGYIYGPQCSLLLFKWKQSTVAKYHDSEPHQHENLGAGTPLYFSPAAIVNYSCSIQCTNWCIHQACSLFKEVLQIDIEGLGDCSSLTCFFLALMFLSFSCARSLIFKFPYTLPNELFI